MHRIATLALAPLVVLAACGDDGGGPPVVENAGFTTPTATTKANVDDDTNGWTEVGPADWSCLDTPSTDVARTAAVTLTGSIRDFQNGTPVRGASITAFPGITTGTVLGTATSDDTAGNAGAYSLELAANADPRIGFKVENTGYLRTYLLNQYLAPGDDTLNISAISEGTANALPAFIGVTRDLADGVLAGALRDCAGREVSNAIATVSSTQGEVDHLDGADTYYFSAASSSLPVRHGTQLASNKDGLFVVLGLAPQTTPAYIQIWGFTTDAELASGDLHLISELASPIEANAVITGSFEAVRN